MPHYLAKAAASGIEKTLNLQAIEASIVYDVVPIINYSD
jgi:hypothetical protein